MAASTGGDEIQEPPAGENSCKPPSIVQQNAEKNEDVSANGAVSCSSFVGANKNPSVLRPSVFSSNTGSAMPVLASNVSSSHCGNSMRRNQFILRPSVFDSAVNSPDKDLAPKKPIVLRASQLDSLADSPVSSTTNSVNSSFVLSPAKLSNPFFKTANADEESSSSAVTSTSLENSKNIPDNSEKVNSSNCLPDVPKVSFVPLASSTNPGNSQTPMPAGCTSTVPSFVFGQNLHERVEVSTELVRSEAESSEAMASDTSTCDGEVSQTNGVTTEMLFSSVIQRELPDKQSDIGNDERKRKSLSEAAREYEESRAIKKKYEEVTVKTGEEEEINILQINCKLFAFNKDKSTWVERGRGTLRLNDLSTDSRTQSRVVMRVSGSLRVVLNTKIWAEMAVDRPSEKSVRLTALDSSGEIKVFLVMASVKEIDQLYKALEWRVNNQKRMAPVCEKSAETNES